MSLLRSSLNLLIVLYKHYAPTELKSKEKLCCIFAPLNEAGKDVAPTELYKSFNRPLQTLRSYGAKIKGKTVLYIRSAE